MKGSPGCSPASSYSFSRWGCSDRAPQRTSPKDSVKVNKLVHVVELAVDYLVDLGLETNHHNGRQTLTEEKFTAREEALCAAVLARYPDVIVEPDEYMGRFFWGFQLDDPEFYVPENPQPGIDYGCDDKMRDPVAIFSGVREAIVGGELWLDLLDRDEYPEGIEP